MSLSSLYYRCRWLHAPVALLVVLCQRTPAVRVAAQLESMFGANAATVLRSGFVVAAMGAYNSVTGATKLSASPASPASAQTGVAFTLSATYTGAPTSPLSMQVTGTLPPGLAAAGVDDNGVVNGGSIVIAGTPVKAGTYKFNIIGWEGANATLLSKSTAYSLTVTGADVPTPFFTLQPKSQTIKTGSSVTLSVSVIGTPAPTLVWRKNGMDILEATATSYTIPSFSASDADSYTVVATNSAGVTASAAAVLTLATLPVIGTQPSSQAVDATDSVTFSVGATGDPAPAYQWRFNGVDIPGKTASSYSKTGVAVSDAGNYTVVVTNIAGSVTSAVAVLAVADIPVITTDLPARTSVNIGGSATLTVAATSGQTMSYQWYKDNVLIAGATGVSYGIPSVGTSDDARYKVIVTNAAGNAISNSVHLEVLTAPVISIQPEATIVTLGAAASFSVTAETSSLKPAYQWRKNGKNISGATSSAYSLTKTTSANAGNYDVVITNTLGSTVSSQAPLTVWTAPAITSKFTATTVGAGESASLTVVATGNPAPTYQWYLDGVAVPGATDATYAISSAVLSQAGNYTVTVTNAVAAVTSSAVAVTVDESPKTLAAGSVFYLTGSASGVAPFTVGDTLTVYSRSLISYADDLASPATIGSASRSYVKVGALGATLKGTCTGVGSKQKYALTLTFDSPTTGTYFNSHVISKVTTTDSGTFVLVPPPSPLPVPPTALAVGNTLHFTGSGTDSGGNYAVDANAVVTSKTEASLTDNTALTPAPATIGFSYSKPVAALASVKTKVTSGGFTATSTIQLLFSTTTSGTFFTTGKDSDGTYYEDGAFTLTP